MSIVCWQRQHADLASVSLCYRISAVCASESAGTIQVQCHHLGSDTGLRLWNETPTSMVWLGTALIVASGVAVLYNHVRRPLTSPTVTLWRGCAAIDVAL